VCPLACQDLQTARQATFSRARANEPSHDPRGHAAPATVEHTDMWSSAHERLTWEVGTFDLRPSQKRTSSLSKLSLPPNSKEFSYDCKAAR
jgi:hypothetical protein